MVRGEKGESGGQHGVEREIVRGYLGVEVEAESD